MKDTFTLLIQNQENALNIFSSYNFSVSEWNTKNI